MKKYLLIIAVLNWTHLRSQDTFYFTKTNLFFELGGPAFLSGNIERLFNISNSLNLVGPAGTKEIDHQFPGFGGQRHNNIFTGKQNYRVQIGNCF
jgi:hypothetical protein